MKSIYLLKKLRPAITFILTIFFSPINAQQPQGDLDPDLPKNAQNIDKETYLKSRADYIAQKRGLPHNLPYDPRILAIEEKIKQEDYNRNNTNFVLAAPNWVPEGPFPIPNGQTTGASVPVSGRVTSIAVHPTNANTLYVGTANGGVYRSVDGGITWTAIFDNAQSLAIGALALAPSSPTTLYVGTGEAALSQDSHFGVGLYRIDNADVSPTLVGPVNPGGIFTFRSISKILVHPTDPATIFVSTGSGVGGIINSNPGTTARGVFRSTNATAAAATITFTKLTVATASADRTIIDMVMEPGTPNNVLCTVFGTNAAGDGGIYRSTNALAASPTFTRTFTSGTATAGRRCELAICKVGAVTTVYAGLDTVGNAAVRSIQKSVDGGATWAPTGFSYGFCGGQCFYDIALAVDPANANNFYIGGSSGNNIFRFSTNGGTSFTTSVNNLHADVHAIVVAPSTPATLYLGCDGGIFKSTNSGVTWASMNTAGFSATQYQSLAIHPVDTKFSIAGAQDNGTSMYKPDATWNRIDFGDGGYTLIDQNATNNTNVTMYHTYFNTTGTPPLLGLARVDLVANAFDGNWPFFGCDGVTANGISCTGTVLFYAPIGLGPGNPNTVYFCSDRLYRSVDKGVNFTTVSQSPIVAGVAISTVAIAKQDDNYRMVGLSNGQVWGTNTGSATLVNITPAGAPATPAQRVYFDPNNKNIAYICYGGFGVTAGQHIWKTINFNAVPTWAASGTGIPDIPVNAFAIDPGNSNVLYAGTDIGVYSSTDAGVNWASFSTGLPIVPVFDMAVHPVSKNLRIATHGRGLWSTTSVVLPITLSVFNATARDNGKVYLEWFTETEQNNKGFEIERTIESTSGNVIWKKIGFVNGSINSSTTKRYFYEDEPTDGKRFLYRLKQVDYDNKFKYSDSRLVTLKGFDYGLYNCYPNPVNDITSVKYKIPENSFVKITVYDNAGKLISNLVNENKAAGIYKVDFSVRNWAAGLYYYKIEAGSFSDTKSFTVSK
jgi:Secretion system C-terminal sorting domain